MSSFLRRISFSSTKSDKETPSENLFSLENPDQARFEEIHKTFTHRDQDAYAPCLVKDMVWTAFNERVLDCGCGYGRTGFTHFLPQVYLHDSHLYSIDTSESLLSFASMKYAHPSISYAAGDVMSDANFPFKYINFDKIFALHVLEGVKDYKAALSRFFTFLKPGGQLGVLCATHTFCDFLDTEFSKDEKWGEYFNLVEKPETSEEFQRHLELVGFEVSKIRVDAMEYAFSSLEKAVVHYIATSPHVKGIPAELQDPFEDDCLERMMSHFHIKEISDPYPTTYNCVYVVAKKPGESQKAKGHKHKRLRERFSLPNLHL